MGSLTKLLPGAIDRPNRFIFVAPVQSISVTRIRQHGPAALCLFSLLTPASALADEEIFLTRNADLRLQPAKLLFFEGQMQGGNPYRVIASLPEQPAESTQDSFNLSDVLEATREAAEVTPIRWLSWSVDGAGVSLGSSYQSLRDHDDSEYQLITPFTVSAYVQPANFVFAPSYQYGVIENRGTKDRISQGVLDFYMLYLAPGGMHWFSFDPSVQRDYQNHRTTYSFEFEAGKLISHILGEGQIYARPGVGYSTDRPYEWNMEVGLRLNY